MMTAVVTGASRGVGKGIARALGAAGHEVYVTGRSTGSAVTHPAVGGTVEQTAAEVDAAGGRGVPVVFGPWQTQWKRHFRWWPAHGSGS